VNEALLAVRTCFDHLLFTGPRTFAGHVAFHVCFTEWHIIFSKSCCCGHDLTRDPSPASYWGDCSLGFRPCGRRPYRLPYGLFPRPLLFFWLHSYVHAPFSLLLSFRIFCTPSHNCGQGAFTDCNLPCGLSRPVEKLNFLLFPI